MPERSAAPRFTKRRSVLLATIIVTGFIVLAEGAARIVGVRDATRPAIIARSVDVDVDFPFMRPDPDLMWAPRPGFAGIFLDRPLRINSLGLRGPEIEAAKPRGRRRIGCFGDSITFGYGVGDAEAYPAQLVSESPSSTTARTCSGWWASAERGISRRRSSRSRGVAGPGSRP